jgi:hypothetical protein
MTTNKDKQRKPERGEKIEGLPVLRPNVAGIDVGSQQHWVCAPAWERLVGGTSKDIEPIAYRQID